MNKQLNVGFVTTLSGRWPRELPENRCKEYGNWLQENLPGINIIKAERLGDSPQALEAVVEQFKTNAVDLIVMVYGAFTGDDASAHLAEMLGVPIILWAPKEPPFEKDTRLFANALVAATMNSASLKKLGYTCYAVYGDKEDIATASKVINLVTAYNVVKKLKGTMLGLFGYRPTAFYNCSFDESLIRKNFGIRIEETDLKVVFDQMDNIPKDVYEADMADVTSNFGTDKLPDGHLENHSKLYLALKDVIKQQAYDFATIKCWPEMGNLHTTPCAVLGRLADEGIHIGCEGDVDAEIAQIVQNYLTGLPTFITDMINIDEEKNIMTFWHCGNAAPSLHNAKYEFSINNHPLAGQGTAFYGSLKPGKVTIARFCNIDGAYKLFLMRGTAVDMERYTKGIMANVKIETPVYKVVEQIWAEGIPHHYSIVWEDVADQMIAVCNLLHIPVIEM
ncbi:L-fucose/L-arabinose isomerase family protein [Pelosinus fermentans]|uniref:L-fucose isomerase-like protein n=1 Tax=Pelosinus fermentans JBW45 TaxID=1192197 RepID=I8TST5_9FIRM|nr:fucose isomerase [Pelosinus fermentans]AJQ28593.1 L-fucose isomerase-like protein [Pelosinus fermentans JBW45]